MQAIANVFAKRPPPKNVRVILRRGRQTLTHYMNGNVNPASWGARLHSFHHWVGSEVSRFVTFS